MSTSSIFPFSLSGFLSSFLAISYPHLIHLSTIVPHLFVFLPCFPTFSLFEVPSVLSSPFVFDSLFRPEVHHLEEAIIPQRFERPQDIRRTLFPSSPSLDLALRSFPNSPHYQSVLAFHGPAYRSFGSRSEFDRRSDPAPSPTDVSIAPISARLRSPFRTPSPSVEVLSNEIRQEKRVY